jgi:acyl-coenzyme A synthetase/AMP-(fatty) acid ligase
MAKPYKVGDWITWRSEVMPGGWGEARISVVYPREPFQGYPHGRMEYALEYVSEAAEGSPTHTRAWLQRAGCRKIKPRRVKELEVALLVRAL